MTTMTHEDFWIRRLEELEDRINYRFKKSPSEDREKIKQAFHAFQAAVLTSAVKLDDAKYLTR